MSYHLGLVNLKEEDILKKQFSLAENGYLTKEVDDFLDKVILDYKQFNKCFCEYKKLLLKYEQAIINKNNRIIALETALEKRVVKIEKQLKVI